MPPSFGDYGMARVRMGGVWVRVCARDIHRWHRKCHCAHAARWPGLRTWLREVLR